MMYGGMVVLLLIQKQFDQNSKLIYCNIYSCPDQFSKISNSTISIFIEEIWFKHSDTQIHKSVCPEVIYCQKQRSTFRQNWSFFIFCMNLQVKFAYFSVFLGSLVDSIIVIYSFNSTDKQTRYLMKHKQCLFLPFFQTGNHDCSFKA